MDCFRRVCAKRLSVNAQINHAAGDSCHSMEQKTYALVQLEGHYLLLWIKADLFFWLLVSFG